MRSAWSKLKRIVDRLIELASELKELGVKGPFGMPLDNVIRVLQERREAIESGYGSPDRWMADLWFFASHLYNLAEGHMAERVLKGKLKEWGKIGVAQPVWDPSKKSLCALLSVYTNGREPIGEVCIPCPDYERSSTECNLKMIEKIRSEHKNLALLIRSIGSSSPILLNPDTLETVDLEEEAKKLLKNLKSELESAFGREIY